MKSFNRYQSFNEIIEAVSAIIVCNCVGEAVYQEMTSVVGYARSGPANSSNFRTQFSAKKLLQQRTKLVKKPPSRSQPSLSKAKIPTFHKQVQVFKYMGESARKSFLNAPENMIITEMLPSLLTASTEKEMHQEISEIIAAESPDYEDCDPNDFEFIRVSRRSA